MSHQPSNDLRISLFPLARVALHLFFPFCFRVSIHYTCMCVCCESRLNWMESIHASLYTMHQLINNKKEGGGDRKLILPQSKRRKKNQFPLIDIVDNHCYLSINSANNNLCAARINAQKWPQGSGKSSINSCSIPFRSVNEHFCCKYTHTHTSHTHMCSIIIAHTSVTSD